MTGPFDSPEPPDSPASPFLNFWSVIFVYLGVLACCAGVGIGLAQIDQRRAQCPADCLG